MGGYKLISSLLATAKPKRGDSHQRIYQNRVFKDALETPIMGLESGSQQGGSGGAIPRPRIQTLSDLIFGLALSIGALTLVGQQPTTTQDLGLALGLYGFSFLILISVWRLYSTITSILPAETAFLVNLNIVLLFFVSIEPYLFNELFALGGTLYSAVSGIYAADLAAMFFILAFFTNSLVDEDKKLIPKSLLRKYRFSRNITLTVAFMFAVSLVPYFGETTILVTHSGGSTLDLTIRSAIWIAALFVGWGGRRLADAVTRQSASA